MNLPGFEGQSSHWCYLDPYDNRLIGWKLINGKWYYLDPTNNGACLIGPGMTPDGYEIDASGAWIGR